MWSGSGVDKLLHLFHSLFHHALEHLVILTHFEHLVQRFSVIDVNSCIIFSSELLSGMSVVL